MDLYMSTVPWPPGLVVAETVTAKHEIARIADRLLRRALAQFERRQRHIGLEGGAGRIGAGERAVDHRPVWRGVELLPAGRVDAVDEQIGIEARLGDEGKYAACVQARSPPARRACRRRPARPLPAV